MAVMLVQRRPDSPVLAVTPRQLLRTTLRPPRLQASPGELEWLIYSFAASANANDSLDIHSIWFSEFAVLPRRVEVQAMRRRRAC